MKNTFYILCFIASSCFSFKVSGQSWDQESLRQLDLAWEEANLHPNPDFLKQLLAEDFIWIHNHNSMTDSKTTVVERAQKALQNKNPNPNSITRSRESREVTVILSGSTAIVTGITVVDRGPSPTTYHFMRTYVWKDGNSQLLANHTMAIPDEEL